MPDETLTSPSLEDQLRWKRELDATRLMARQTIPGFYPGPGAAAGGAGGGVAAGGGATGGGAGGGAAGGNKLPGGGAGKGNQLPGGGAGMGNKLPGMSGGGQGFSDDEMLAMDEEGLSELDIERIRAAGGPRGGGGGRSLSDRAGSAVETGGQITEKAGKGVETAGKGVEMAGKGVEMAGKGTEMAGEAVEMGGKAAEAAGQAVSQAGSAVREGGQATMQAGSGMVEAGVGMSSTGLGAIVGVPLAIAGVGVAGVGAGATGAGAGMEAGGKGMEAGGKGAQAAGKGVKSAGKGMQEAGKGVQEAGKGVQESGKGMQQAGGQMADMGKQMKQGMDMTPNAQIGQQAKDALKPSGPGGLKTGQADSPTGSLKDTAMNSPHMKIANAAGSSGGGGGGGGGMPGGGGGGMPGGKVMQAYQQGGSKSDQMMRMAGAGVSETAEGVGKAFGPKGAVIGQAVSEASTMGTEGAIAAKNLITSGGDLGSRKAAAKAFKSQVVDKIWWPGVIMFPMNFLVYIPCLQVYWFASLLKCEWTTEMRMWEHMVIAFITAVQFFILCFILAILGFIPCLIDWNNCGRDVADRLLPF